MRHREIVRGYLDAMDKCVKPVAGGIAETGFGLRYQAAAFDSGPGASYSGYYEKTAPFHDLAVSRGDIRISGRSRQRLLGDDMMRVRLSIAGEGRIEGLAASEPAYFDQRTCILVDQAPGAELVQTTDADSRHCGITLLVPRFLLTSAWGIERNALPPFFREFEERNQREARAVTMPMAAELTWTVLEIMRCPLRGEMLKLYLGGKAKEILSVLLHQLQEKREDDHSPVVLRRRDIKLLHEARRIAADNFTRPPGISELAAAVGTNRNKLCAGFKRLFGQSVFEYCRELRMQQALKLLREGDAPLVRIARQIGYQHAPAFSAAFKKRFGCSPKDCRDRHDIPPAE